MAWKASFSLDQQWDTPIKGLRWLRRRELSGYKYLYMIDDFGAVPDELMPAAEQMEWGMDVDHVNNIKTAAEWSLWEHASTFWTPELAEEEEEENLAKSVVSSDPVRVHDEVDVTVGEALVDREPPRQDNVPSTRLGDPQLESVRPAYYAHRGAYSWPVKILVQAQNEQSWVIQKVQTSGPDGTDTFWEAFPVGPNTSEADFQDIYMSPVSKAQQGTRTVRGLMQHFVFTGGAEPPGMTPGGSEGADREGLSTTTVPPFWSDSGTPHDLDMKWGAFGTDIKTIPDSGPPERKEIREL
jgi:hypothetical protein